MASFVVQQEKEETEAAVKFSTLHSVNLYLPRLRQQLTGERQLVCLTALFIGSCQTSQPISILSCSRLDAGPEGRLAAHSRVGVGQPWSIWYVSVKMKETYPRRRLHVSYMAQSHILSLGSSVK
uniref:Uncharacterized protein n=1 Tax=Micrurus surinamensis TaxID=129470 RepID=A0A2D4Q2Y1_MICSU